MKLKIKIGRVFNFELSVPTAVVLALVTILL